MKGISIWVFRSFGWRAGFAYIWDAVCLGLKRLVGKREKPVSLQNLTAEEVEKVVLGNDIHKQDDQSHKHIYTFDKTLN